MSVCVWCWQPLLFSLSLSGLPPSSEADVTAAVLAIETHCFSLLLPETEDPNAVLCLYKTENECVMKFTYSEHANGQSVLTALEEPGEWTRALAARELIPVYLTVP